VEEALMEGVEAAEDVDGVATEGVVDALKGASPRPEPDANADVGTVTTFEILRASIFQT
jgi:hypothetical protein